LVEEFPEYGAVVPKHVGVIKDYSILDVYVSMCILLVSYKKISLFKCTGCQNCYLSWLRA